MAAERLVMGDGMCRDGHEFRYRLAAGFCTPGMVVVDAACGTGYGSHLLGKHLRYVGIDRSLVVIETTALTIRADLTTWEPDFDIDVFISFETIEHLDDYTALIAAAKTAGHWIIMSVPVVPTAKTNPFHVHDFTPGDLDRLIVDDNWRHYQTVQQPQEFSEISVFERRGPWSPSSRR